MVDTTQKTALVVEDHDAWRTDLAHQLEKMGFKALRAEDADTAIELLNRVPDIELLVLDWDLRGKVALPTAYGEDVLSAARKRGKHLKTIVVTGAIDNPEYLGFRHASADDELWTMLKYRPFAVLRKKDMVSERDTGFSSFREAVLETNILDSSAVRDENSLPARLEMPFQLHWPTGRLIDKNGNHLSLPPKFSFVIREMLDRDPSNPKRGSIRRELLYSEVAEKYVEGWAVQNLKRPHDDKEFRKKVREKAVEIETKPDRLAQQWAREFRRFLKNQGIGDADAIIQCCRVRRMYTLGMGWNHANPVLDRSEVGIVRMPLKE